jgi:DNA polymerase-3 subunit alpha
MYLNCHTHFSFKYGTLTANELIDEAVRCGVRKFVLTDINSTAAYIELLRIIKEREATDKLEVALGIEFRNESELQYVAIAKNNAGFQELNAFLSFHANEETPLPRRAPEFKDSWVIYPWRKIQPEELRDHEFIGIKLHQVSQFVFNPQPHLHKFVAWHPVTFKNSVAEDSKTTATISFNTHRLLRAIDNNVILSKLDPVQQALENEVMMSEEALHRHYAQCPELLKNANTLLHQCHAHFELNQDKNKRSFTGDETSDWDYLVSHARKGMEKRYPLSNALVAERFDRELRIIKAKKFCTYFLITYDIVEFAKKSAFDYVGRGSGANSLIAYCLGITNVDPIELDLYFERFLNPERSSPPDFDLDFSWKDRDAVIEYIFKKYGTKHACLLGTHTTYQRKSIVRELGKVFGLPKEEIDDIVDYPEQNKSRDSIRKLILRYADRLVDKPANISIHAGGILITEEPIYAYTATTLPPKGFPVSHIEMHNAEDIGIYKLDILSQRGLGHIKESIGIIKNNTGINVDINRFEHFKKDKKIRALLESGKTMGCFYVESPAMRMLLGKLQCNDYITLVAASSIIRPGVASSGMMRAYIERHHNMKNGGTYESIHPKMDELMKETYGVMVYQEDLIKVAHYFAGLTLAEADTLRRGMSGKFRSRLEFEKVKAKFFENCKKLNYADSVTRRVWFEIESFSGYSFSKGHSASYAVESYQSLYLKAHYPLEFMVAVINNFGGFYASEFYFHEARMSGGVLEPPCVNSSYPHTSITGTNIYIGFIHLKSLQANIAHAIDIERMQNGDYRSLSNFISRIKIGLEQVRILIRIGAFRFTGKSKQKLLWEAMLYFSEFNARKLIADELFNSEPDDYPLPLLERNELEDAFDEMELLGFALCDPFMLLTTKDYGDTLAAALMDKLHKRITIVGYNITRKDTRTKNNQLMYFGTFYDHRGNVFDTVHFPAEAKKFPFRGRGFYRIHGTVTEDFGVPMIEIIKMERLPFVSRIDLVNTNIAFQKL